MPARKSKVAPKALGSPANTPPNWPVLKPLIPPSSLSLTTLIPSQIVIIQNLFPSSLCKSFVQFLKTLPLITTPGKPKKGDAVRVNDRYQVIDEAFAQRLWVETGLRELVTGDEEGGGLRTDGEEMNREERERLWGGEVIGLNPSIRIYRYTKGQFFDQHYDESNVLTLNNTPAKTTWTLLLYLTSPATGCIGGETVFYPDEVDFSGMGVSKMNTIEKEFVVGLETGMCLLHKHGNDCMLHEGREVTGGEKWVIRSDLCVKRERAGFFG